MQRECAQVRKETLAISLAMFIAGRGLAYDAGPHQELTTAAMADFGFTSDAIGTARLNNWLIDYYSNTGDYQAELGLLHFDNLPTTHNVKVYWGYFTNNTRRSLEAAARANSPYKALSILGMSLHALQDFYTHSTWVETHPRGAGGFRAETYFTDPPPDNNEPQKGLYTGLYPGGDQNVPGDSIKYHGSYFWGVNHDQYNCPRHDQSYVFGYSATVQWIRAVRKWVEAVSPGFYNQMVNYSDAPNRGILNRDLLYVYYLSDWAYDPRPGATTDGRWKAFGSGSASDFIPCLISWQTTADDKFTLNFKFPRVWFRELTPGLDNLTGLIPRHEPIPKPTIDRRAIIVRTTMVRDDTTFGVDIGGNADYFAVLNIRGQQLIEPVARDKSFPLVLWQTVKLVPASATDIPIVYSLWDEDTFFFGGFQGTDDHCDINPAAGPLDLVFSFNVATHRCTGDVNGVFDSPSRMFRSSGADQNDSTVWFYVTESPVIEP